MNFEQLQYFRIVAEEENLGRASQRLHITQQGLSANIIKLENELGVYLFDRIGRKIFLNENGRRFLNYADLLLSDYRAALESVHSHPQENRTISIATTGRNIASKLIMAYLSCNSGVSICVRNIDTVHIPYALTRKNADFVVTSFPYTSPETESLELFQERFCAAVPLEHPVAALQEVSLQELQNERFALTSEADTFRQDVNAMCAKGGFTPNVIISSYPSDPVFRAVQSGIAITFVGELSNNAEEMRVGRGIKLVPLKESFARRSIYLVWLKNGLTEEHLRLFRSYAEESAGELYLNPLL